MGIIMLFEINNLNLIGILVTGDLLLLGEEEFYSVPYFWLYKNTFKTLVAFLRHDHICL
jgi:hypothetical protein